MIHIVFSGKQCAIAGTCDANTVLKSMISRFDGKGGGNKKFAQGTLDSVNTKTANFISIIKKELENIENK